MKAPRNTHHSQLVFPTSASQGSGQGLEPSSHQMGAAATQASKEMKGNADMATTRAGLAQLAPTSNFTHMAGMALHGLKKAANF